METLSSEINNFESRSKSIFDSLISLEHNHKEKESEYVSQNEEIIIKKENEEEKHVHSDMDYEFKIPCIDSYKRQLKNSSQTVSKHQKKTPDHIINPDKWIKYSLEDVDASQMSTSANFYAAMNFLNKTNDSYNDMKLSESDIVYNKPIGANKMETNRDSYSQIGKHLLEKLNEDQDEIFDNMDKMDITNTNNDEIQFKKISKSKNLRASRKSTEEDLESQNLNQEKESENKDQSSDDDAFDEFDKNEDINSQENEFGDDFEKF